MKVGKFLLQFGQFFVGLLHCWNHLWLGIRTLGRLCGFALIAPLVPPKVHMLAVLALPVIVAFVGFLLLLELGRQPFL